MDKYDTGKDLKYAESQHKKGVEALKTSFFRFKFDPDYLGAVTYFTEAGAVFKKLRYFKESLASYGQAILCNQKLNERWAEGKNQCEMAEIYIIEQKENELGFKCIERAVMCFKLYGKFDMAVRIYLDFAEKCVNTMNGEFGMKLLKLFFDDCHEYTHDELARIVFEEGFKKLVDVFSQYGRFTEALDYVNKYIKKQLTLKDEKRSKITQNYIRSIMLRLILKEDFVCDEIIGSMYTIYDSGCGDDVEDAKQLTKSFKELNAKKFNDLMKYSFDFFENNLLKGLRAAYETRTKQDSVGIGSTNSGVIELDSNKVAASGDGNFADSLV